MALQARQHRFHVGKLLFKTIALVGQHRVELCDLILETEILIGQNRIFLREGAADRINQRRHAVVDDSSQPGGRVGKKLGDIVRIGVERVLKCG